MLACGLNLAGFGLSPGNCSNLGPNHHIELSAISFLVNPHESKSAGSYTAGQCLQSFFAVNIVSNAYCFESSKAQFLNPPSKLFELPLSLAPLIWLLQVVTK